VIDLPWTLIQQDAGHDGEDGRRTSCRPRETTSPGDGSQLSRAVAKDYWTLREGPERARGAGITPERQALY